MVFSSLEGLYFNTESDLFLSVISGTLRIHFEHLKAAVFKIRIWCHTSSCEHTIEIGGT